jgi:predicted GIY-YIG superfamily endonuclease
MKVTPKTIQIFLPGGDPRGIRIAEITTRIVQVIEVPRSLLQDFLAMSESNQVALYFLFGDEGEGEENKVYIGQTGDLRERLKKHNKEKDFWQRALVLISRTNSLTQTHALFLEWYCLQATKKASRYTLENGNIGSKPHTPAPLEADCLEIFETGSTLLATLGYPAFDAVGASIESSNKEEIFYCKASEADGRGLYTPEGFVVLKGSNGRKVNVQSIKNTAHERYRNKLLNSGVMRTSGKRVIFEKDHLFGSPSMAALALMGRAANGWLEWRDKNGVTLDEMKRPSEAAK